MNQLSFLSTMPIPPQADSDEWFTPSSVFRPLNEEFRFTLDPCATAESAKCRRFFHAGQDGLAQDWGRERIWLNPPYSDITPWVAKAAMEVSPQAHGSHRSAELVVGLLPAWTDRAWWHTSIEPFRDGRSPVITVELRFVCGRIRFGFPGDPEGLNARGGGTFPSVIVIWRPRRLLKAQP